MHLVWAWNPRAKKCFTRTRKGRGRNRTRLQAVGYNRQSDREGQQGMDTLRKGAHALTTAHRASLRSSPGLRTWCGLGTQEPISVFPEPGKGGSDTHASSDSDMVPICRLLDSRMHCAAPQGSAPGVGLEPKSQECFAGHSADTRPGSKALGYNRARGRGLNRSACRPIGAPTQGLRVFPTTRLQGARRYPPPLNTRLPAGGR